MAEALHPGETAESPATVVDPRILRSRRMLQDALRKLLHEKDFEAISVQEIADEATLNRATFYLHYPDKTALLRAMTECRFRALIAKRGLEFSNCDGALRAIALGVCDYLADTTGCPSRLLQLPLESTIIQVVEGMFLEGSSHHTEVPRENAALLSATAAWAVFGAARKWLQTPNRVPAELMAEQIEAMVRPLLMSGTAAGG